MMNAPYLKAGDKFNHWTVLRESDRKGVGRVYFWCLCDCGSSEREVSRYALKYGVSQSCVKCCNRKYTESRHSGQSKPTPEFMTWRGIQIRCNPNYKRYRRYYFERGIKVCARWRGSFDLFLADMGRRPSPTHSIDRIDNDGDYEPRNCRWATKKEQMNNRSNNRHLTVNGKTNTVGEWTDLWSAQTGISKSVIQSRLALGWTVEKAINIPTRNTWKTKL